MPSGAESESGMSSACPCAVPSAFALESSLSLSNSQTLEQCSRSPAMDPLGSRPGTLEVALQRMTEALKLAKHREEQFAATRQARSAAEMELRKECDSARRCSLHVCACPLLMP